MSLHERETRQAFGITIKRLNLPIAQCRRFLFQLDLHSLRKFAIAVLGGSVVLVGIAMLVLPGPAILVIPLGLAILATEFLWARRWLKRARALLPNGHKQLPPPVPTTVASGKVTARMQLTTKQTDKGWHRLPAETAGPEKKPVKGLRSPGN
jgi:hypothetical protein